MSKLKSVEFCGSALDDLRTFPISARREAGPSLTECSTARKLTTGSQPTIGQGVREIRIRDAAGAFWIVYVAKFTNAIYVIHCFQKKTQKTSKADLDLAESRYRDLIKEPGK